MLTAGVGCRLGIQPRVDDDNGDLGVAGLDQGRDNLARAARRDAEHADAGLDQVLDDLHLLLDVDLALGRLHVKLDAEAVGGLLGAAPHVHEEGMVQRLENQRDRSRAHRRRPAGAARLQESDDGRDDAAINDE